MSARRLNVLLALVAAAPTLGLASSLSVADDADVRGPSPAAQAASQAAAQGLYPMQILTPPMWQPHPPAWYRPDLGWQRYQPKPIEKPEKVERPALSHWERHAPEWMNLPPDSRQPTLWVKQPLVPASADAPVTEVAPPQVAD